MAEFKVQLVSRTPITPTLVANVPTNANNPLNMNTNRNGMVFFWLKNSGGSGANITFLSIGNCNQGFDHDITFTVPAASERIVGPFPTDRWQNIDDGNMDWTSAATTLTIGIFAVSTSTITG